MPYSSFQSERKREVKDDKVIQRLHNQRQNSNHKTSCYRKTTKPQLEKYTTNGGKVLDLNLAHWNENILEGRPDQKSIPREGPSSHMLLISKRGLDRVIVISSPPYAKLCAQHTAQIFPFSISCAHIMLFPSLFPSLNYYFPQKLGFWLSFFLQYNTLT